MNQDNIPFNKYITHAPDNEVWRPIKSEQEKLSFEALIENVEYSKEHGTKKQKGDALESLMDFVYKRFDFVDEVIHNRRTNDNQIDHIISFLDHSTPKFIYDNTRNKIIGESKNHNKSISTREVSNLDELMRDNEGTLGIFSAYNSFSKGKNLWCGAEGKRRKLALANKRIIIGFNFADLKSLTYNNFYTMIRQKFKNVVDELDDDFSDIHKIPYHEQLHQTLLNMKKLDLISDESYIECRDRIVLKYGQVSDIL